MKKLLNIFLFLFYATTALAQTSPAEILKQHLSQIKTFKSDFTQTVQDKNGNILQKSQGKMALTRPGLFRWETTSPNQQLIIADGKTIWINDKDLQQVTHQKQNISSNTPGLLLSDSPDKVVQKFTVSRINDNTFKLTPKGKKDLFQFVTLYFEQDNNNSIKQMTLNDSFGQITQIMFTNVKSNIALPKNLFEFTPPKNLSTTE